MNNKEKYTHGFKTPENYFEEFDNRFFETMLEKDLPENTGFKVPDNYFAPLEEQILSKITENPTKKVRPLFAKKWMATSTAIAACAVVGLLLWNPSTNNTEIQLTDIEAYLDEGLLDMDSYDIAQVMTDDDLIDLSLETNLFSEENLETYLLENLDDTSLLIE